MKICVDGLTFDVSLEPWWDPRAWWSLLGFWWLTRRGRIDTSRMRREARGIFFDVKAMPEGEK